MLGRFRPEEKRLVVELKEGQNVGPLLDAMGDVRSVEVQDELDRRVVTLELDALDEHEVGRISDLDYVIGVRWRR